MYQVVINKKMAKTIDALPNKIQAKILTTITELQNNPRPHGCKKLVGTDNEYRIRVEVYRIVYTIQDNILTITIIAVDHRKDVYR
jgi:mRNA interferase RelE/StbE